MSADFDMYITLTIKTAYGEYRQILGKAIVGVDKHEVGILMGRLGSMYLYIEEEVSGYDIPLCPDCNQPIVKSNNGWLCACQPPPKVVSPNKKSIPLLSPEESAAITEATGQTCNTRVDRTKPFNPGAAMAAMKQGNTTQSDETEEQAQGEHND